jgi:hypothetical protein
MEATATATSSKIASITANNSGCDDRYFLERCLQCIKMYE